MRSTWPRQQYTQGLASFLSFDVLTAERTLYTAEEAYADSTTTISTNLVQLYKALGGGWEDAFPARRTVREGAEAVLGERPLTSGAWASCPSGDAP